MIDLLSPLTLFWLLLAGGVAIPSLARWRFRHGELAAASISGLATLIWLLLRNDVPLEIRVSDWPAVAQLPPWNWQVDEIAWRLTGCLLLLLTGSLLVASSVGATRGRAKEMAAAANVPASSLAMLLVAATLVCLWASSLAGVMAGWILLLVVWAGAQLLANGDGDMVASQVVPRMGWLLLSLFFLWLAAAFVPVGANFSLSMTEWPQVATSSVLTAALLQMGVWPFYGWRQLSRPAHPALAILLPVLPSIAGASLLARLVGSSDISTGYALFLTAFGLLGLLLAVQRLWLRLHSPNGMLGALALGLTSVALLGGTWAGAGALVAQTTVMALLPGFFFLAFATGMAMPRWARVVGGLVALAAMAGLPPMVGLAGVGTLYDGLLAQGRWLLVLVTALLYVPFLAAVLLSAWRYGAPEGTATEMAGGNFRLVNIAWLLGLVLPAVGLLSFSALAETTVRFEAWLALLLPVLGALALVRYVGSVEEARLALQHAFDWHLLAALPHFVWRTWLRRLDTAVRDAAAILDGEGGMLWMLVLAVVLLVVR